jgi:hypothetical protein
MAEIDDVLAELRQRIMRPSESGPPKSVPEPVEAITLLPARGLLHPAMTQPVDQRHGSADAALRRLAHPERDGGVEDAPASEPINPGRDGGVAVADDPASQVSQLIRRLSLDMPELLEEVVALIERRTAELDERDEGAAPRLTESVALVAPVRAAAAVPDDDTGTATISLRLDTWLLARIDADARRRGISRTAWLHIAASERLEGQR